MTGKPADSKWQKRWEGFCKTAVIAIGGGAAGPSVAGQRGLHRQGQRCRGGHPVPSGFPSSARGGHWRGDGFGRGPLEAAAKGAGFYREAFSRAAAVRGGGLCSLGAVGSSVAHCRPTLGAGSARQGFCGGMFPLGKGRLSLLLPQPKRPGSVLCRAAVPLWRGKCAGHSVFECGWRPWLRQCALPDSCAGPPSSPGANPWRCFCCCICP